MSLLTQQFQSFLQGSKKLSPTTITSYVSDAQSFINFLSQSLQEPTITPQHITPATIKAFQIHLSQTTSPATADRRLSSLRKLCFFLEKTNKIEQNPLTSHKIKPISPSSSQLLHQYSRHLQTQKLAASSIQNYLSDAKAYLLWASQHTKSTDRQNNPTPVD